MAAEADSRGFFAAERRAFLGDGQAYNWKIHKRCFATFEPILDFVHPLPYLHAAARAIEPDDSAAWTTFQSWATMVWLGETESVIALLEEATPSTDDESDRESIDAAKTYLTNNRTRMDYPRYRREGLPTSSAMIESQIKEMNYRVKGTEKFWNDGASGEAILSLRSALLSDDDRLGRHIRERPGSPYARQRIASVAV